MILQKTPETIDEVAETLKKGKVCVLPTDTVYGLSAVAEDPPDIVFNTAERLRAIKGREESKGFIRLIANARGIRRYSDYKIPPYLESKWPGALTMVIPCRNGEKIAFRCPGDAWLRAVIQKCGRPVYSTSANISGHPTPALFLEIQKEFKDKVDLIVCDGDKENAVPSTIVSLEGGTWSVLRQGGVIV